MRKRVFANIYAIICTLALATGCVLAFYFAWSAGTAETVSVIVGILLSLILAPTLHECGHIVFAVASDMEIAYAKFFCFRLQRKKGKLRLGLASPFGAEETQAIPKKGGNMKRRACAYTLGGLLFSAVMIVLLLVCASVFSYLDKNNFLCWGLLPYTAYLFVLNALPLEYGSGKTDALIFRGIKKGYDAEKTMLSAMEIQGRLYAGESFSQIEERWYYELPQLAEDEPLFAVILDLRYRYHLEKEEFEKSATCLNRLVSVQEYLPDSEVEKIAGELVYMHAVHEDYERAKACGEACKEYLAGDSAQAKRILATYSSAFGQTDAVAVLKAQAESALQYERLEGVRKFEKILLSRIPTA